MGGVRSRTDWVRAKLVLAAYFDQDPDDREGFLEAACAGDPALRALVDEYVPHLNVATAELFPELGEVAARLLDITGPNPDTFAELMRRYETGVGTGSPTLPWAEDGGESAGHIGRVFDNGRFKVVRPLGKGGMGTVYLAERIDGFKDEVAVKFLHKNAASAWKSEASLLKDLNHPHIVSYRLADVTDDGHPYAIMQYIRGGLALDEYCNANKYSLRERLGLFATVCDTLHHIHEKNVIHCDVKPTNLLVTEDGLLQVLDFGISVRVEDELARTEPKSPSERAMTRSVASPEQYRGERLTPVSDVYALGVVLYQLVTGQPPFPDLNDDNAAERICETAPEAPSELVAKVVDAAFALAAQTGWDKIEVFPEGLDPGTLAWSLRGELDAVILRAMAKAPEQRYSSAAKLGAAIRRCFEHPKPDASVVVLGFENLAEEADAPFVAGLSEAITTALARVPGLRVSASTSVAALKARNLAPEEMVEQLGARTALTGTVERDGDQYGINLRLFDVASINDLKEGLVWAEPKIVTGADVFALQELVGKLVVEKIAGNPEAADEEPDLHSMPSWNAQTNRQAYDEFVEGLDRLTFKSLEGYERGIQNMKRATELDPGFAHPWAHLAVGIALKTAYGFQDSRDMPTVLKFATWAHRKDPSIPDSHCALGLYYQYYKWDWEKTEYHYNRAMLKRPGDARTYAWLAIHHARLKRWQQAFDAVDKALELQPLSRDAQHIRQMILLFHDEYEESIACARDLLAVYPGYHRAILMEQQALSMLGRHEEALARCEEAHALQDRDPHCHGALAWCLARVSKADGVDPATSAACRRKAEEITAKMQAERDAGEPYFPAVPLSWGYLGLEMWDEMFAALEAAYTDREGLAAYIGSLPAYGVIGDDERFKGLLHRLGLPLEASGRRE